MLAFSRMTQENMMTDTGILNSLERGLNDRDVVRDPNRMHSGAAASAKLIYLTEMYIEKPHLIKI